MINEKLIAGAVALGNSLMIMVLFGPLPFLGLRDQGNVKITYTYMSTVSQKEL